MSNRPHMVREYSFIRNARYLVDGPQLYNWRPREETPGLLDKLVFFAGCHGLDFGFASAGFGTAVEFFRKYDLLWEGSTKEFGTLAFGDAICHVLMLL